MGAVVPIPTKHDAKGGIAGPTRTSPPSVSVQKFLFNHKKRVFLHDFRKKSVSTKSVHLCIYGGNHYRLCTSPHNAILSRTNC